MFPIPSTLLIKIGIIVIALGLAYWSGYDRMRDKHLLFVAEVKRVGEAQEAANKSAVEIATVITEGVKDEYETRIAALRRQYAGRVQQCNSGSGQVSTGPKSSSSVAGSADDPAIIGLCAEETAKLVALQKWVKLNMERSK
jgi:hypothetical protein